MTTEETHYRVQVPGSPFQRECTCGWYAYGARDQYDADRDLSRHIDQEWDKARARAAAEKERVRLLSEGQNWDIP